MIKFFEWRITRDKFESHQIRELAEEANHGNDADGYTGKHVKLTPKKLIIKDVTHAEILASRAYMRHRYGRDDRNQ